MTRARRGSTPVDARPGFRIRRAGGATALLKALRFNAQGLIPAVIQDAKSRQILTLCYLNRAALRKSLATGTVHLFRRSHRRLMQKGEVYGHIQVIRQILVDCEGNSLVLRVRQHVAGCHTGYFSCYFRCISRTGTFVTVGRKVFDPKKVYRESDQ